MSGLKLNKYMSNFHPLDVVGRDSEAQRQVGENLNCLFQLFNPYSAEIFLCKLWRQKSCFNLKSS